MSWRQVDPYEDAHDATNRAEGVRSQRDMEERDDRGERFIDDVRKRLIVVQESITWYRANVGASGDSATGYIMRVGGQSSDTAWASLVLPLNALGQGRLLTARLWSSEVCTTGVARLALRIVEGSDTELFSMDDVEIDATTNTQQAATKWDWEVAKQFSGSATLEARIVTESSFAPTTADMTAVLTFGYETWVSS